MFSQGGPALFIPINHFIKCVTQNFHNATRLTLHNMSDSPL